MKVIKDYFTVIDEYKSGKIDYNEFSKIMRTKKMFILQFSFLSVFIFAAGLLMNIPYIYIPIVLVFLAYALILQSRAKSVKDQFKYAFIWGISSFIIATFGLYIMVEVFGYMQK